MTYRVPERVYRSADGRLVHQDDPKAAFLAFVVGDELSDTAARREGLPEFFAKKNRAQPPQDKQAAKPADKAVSKPEDKSAASDEPEAVPEPEAKDEAAAEAPPVAPARRKPGPKPGTRRS